MIVYEVRVEVDAEVAERYRAWLDGHVHGILAIPGFTGAELYREDQAGARSVFTVRYHLAARAALERYLREHAPRMRADAEANFGGRFAATRRVLELVRNYSLRL